MANPSIGVKPADYPPPPDQGAGQCEKPPALANAGSDKQSQEFQAAFQTQYNSINGHLEYTSVNAEEALNKPLVARRDALPAAYQSALGQVDPEDVKKAKAAIEKVLATAKALNGDVTKFRTAAEKAFNDWKSRQPKFDEAAQHIQELEAWVDPKAAALRAVVDGIAKMVSPRKYATACTTLDQFLPKLKPIYEEYLRQKAAKEKYDAAMELLKPKLDATQISCYHKLEPIQKAIGALTGQMEKAVEAKNYVQALKLSGDLSPKAEEFIAKQKALDDRKKEYEGVLAAMTAKSPGPVKIPAKLAPMEKDMGAIRQQMEAAAKDEDYDKALKFARDLSVKYDVYLEDLKQALKKAQEYDDDWAKVQPRLPASTPPHAKLEPMCQDLEKVRKLTEDAAKKEDYDKALQSVKDLSVKLDAYEAAAKEIEKQKEAYEKMLEPLEKRLEKACEAEKGKLTVLQKEIIALKKKMEEEAGKDAYDQAMSCCVQLPAKLDAFDQATNKSAIKKVTYGGTVEFAEKELKKFHAGKYVKGEVKISGSVKFTGSPAEGGEAEIHSDEEAKSALSKFIDEQFDDAEVGWKTEGEAGLTYNKGKGTVGIDAGVTFSTGYGPFKFELAPLEASLISYDKKKGWAGPKFSPSATATVALKHTIKGIEFEGAVSAKLTTEFTPDYLAVGEWVLEKYGPEALGSAAPVVGGIVGGIALCAGTMAVIDALEKSGADSTRICQEAANRLRDYATSYGSAVRGTPGKNALGNQDAEAYLQWIMRTLPGITHNDAVDMCKESGRKYEDLAWHALLPQMRDDVQKAYNAAGHWGSIHQPSLLEFLGDNTHP